MKNYFKPYKIAILKILYHRKYKNKNKIKMRHQMISLIFKLNLLTYFHKIFLKKVMSVKRIKNYNKLI